MVLFFLRGEGKDDDDDDVVDQDCNFFFLIIVVLIEYQLQLDGCVIMQLNDICGKIY